MQVHRSVTRDIEDGIRDQFAVCDDDCDIGLRITNSVCRVEVELMRRDGWDA